MVTLTLTEKGGEPKQLTFDKDEVTVGRVQGNDVVLPKGNVSKRHCRIFLDNGQFSVEDMKSTNGTYVNGRKIGETTTVSGSDKIYVGDFVIKIEGAGAEDLDPLASLAPPPGPEAGSLSTALPRRPPPPPPPSRGTGTMRAVEEDVAVAKGRSSGRITASPPPPPPPPPRRETGRAMPTFGADSPLPPPSPADIDLDDDALATQPPRLNVPPLKPVFSVSDEDDREDDQNARDEKDDKHDKDEPITAQRGRAVLPSPAPRTAGPTLSAAAGTDLPGWLDRLLDGDGVSAVFVTGTHTVEVERQGHREPGSASAGELAELGDIVRTLAARGTPRPSADAAIVNAILPNGVRITAVFPPVAAEVSVAIQRPAAMSRSLGDLVSDGVLSKEMHQLLEACTSTRRNLLVAGDRRAAEALVQALANTIASRFRVVVIADRISPPGGNPGWTRLSAEPRNPDLLAAAVSLRPDYLLVDVGNATLAADVVHECALGQEGSVVSMAARSPAEALARLQTLVGPGSTAMRELAVFAFDAVVHVATLSDGSARVLEVGEPKLEADGRISVEPLLVWRGEPGGDPRAGRFQVTGAPSRLSGALAARGVHVPANVLRR